MHWNLMNSKEFGSLKLLKLKYRKGGVVSNNSGVRSPHLIFGNFKSLTKVLVNHEEYTET